MLAMSEYRLWEQCGSLTDIAVEGGILEAAVVRSSVVVVDTHRGRHTVDRGRTTWLDACGRVKAHWLCVEVLVRSLLRVKSDLRVCLS